MNSKRSMADREEASGSQTLHQRNVVQNRDPGPSQKGSAGGSKKSWSLVQRTSASPIMAVCITTVSFMSRIGVISKAFG